MINQLELQAPPKRCNLILHCGASSVPRPSIGRVSTPRPTESWTPIPHNLLVEQVEKTLYFNGIQVVGEAHSLTREGDRYFGLLEVRNGNDTGDYGWVLGLRNSHDKTFPAGIVAGAAVFVCDNLSFSGEVRIARKHTRHILRDLPELVQGAVGNLMERWFMQDNRIAAYKSRSITDKAAHDLIIRACDVGACTNRHIPLVLGEWREPTHEEFEIRNLWSLFNAFTEVLKGSLAVLPDRTQALHGLFDHHVGLGRMGNNN
jgi:hypothetical protein